jgi:hypothetical protein
MRPACRSVSAVPREEDRVVAYGALIDGSLLGHLGAGARQNAPLCWL